MIKLIKDFSSVSFKPKNVPAIFFVQGEYETHWSMTQDYKQLRKPNNVFVSLTCKLSAKKAGIEAYELIVVQYGLFEIIAAEDELKQTIERCLEQLFPYAKLQVANSLHFGGFPVFTLPPIDFSQCPDKTVTSQRVEEPDPAAGVGLRP